MVSSIEGRQESGSLGTLWPLDNSQAQGRTHDSEPMEAIQAPGLKTCEVNI